MSNLIKAFEEILSEAELSADGKVIIPVHDARELLTLLKTRNDEINRISSGINALGYSVDEAVTNFTLWMAELDRVKTENNTLMADNLRHMQRITSLQSEIDSANAQKPLMTIDCRDFSEIKATLHSQVDHPQIFELFRRPIPAQQSPAVAVPDCIEASLTWLDAALTCKSFIWDGDQYDAAKYELEQAKLWLEKKSANPSPRITEQDAREIELVNHLAGCLNALVLDGAARGDMKIEIAETDTVLTVGEVIDRAKQYLYHWRFNKINEANHAAYDPVQLLETARTALADIGNAKDLTLEAAQRKAKRIYREIRQAMDGEENAT